MGGKAKVNIDIFKAVTSAIAKSDDLPMMTDHLTQLLTAGLGIKACSIFVLNPQTDEMERLSSFGLSIEYLNKGPIFSRRSLGTDTRGEVIVIPDISDVRERLQYPEAAEKEGIRAVVSFPIVFGGRILGALRLYHGQAWDLPDADRHTLRVLAENVGLAMSYVRLQTAFQEIQETVDLLSPKLVGVSGSWEPVE
jgi:GAF domain-containing protein